MKGYLLLNDGSLFEGKVIGEIKNVLGETHLDDQGAVKIQCPATSTTGLIVNNSNDIKGHLELSDVDFKSLKLKVEKNKKLLSKIVTDSLPIDYHVYDLKTFITSGLK